MQTRAKACDISVKVKRAVWARDNQRCIICGSPYAMPNAHYISRAKGGLGVEQNIVTLCMRCHDIMDHSVHRKRYLAVVKAYLESKYKNWNEEELSYGFNQRYASETNYAEHID